MSSIRRRLTLRLALVLAVLWGGGGLVLFLAVRAQLVSEFDRGLEGSARALAALTSEDQGVVELDFHPQALPAFARAERPDYFQMWLSDGSTGWRSPSLGEGDLPRVAGTLEAPVFGNLTLPDGLAGRSVALRFVPRPDEDTGRPADAPGPVVTLVVARSSADLDQRLHLLASALLLVGLATALATAVLVPVVVRRGLRPLDGVATRAAEIDATALDVRFPTADMPAELRPICERLNALLGRLQASFERERRFSADVAHEMRTPIAELRASAETALRWPDDPAATARALQDALEIAIQMESTTAGLLALARCEAGLQPAAREAIPLAALLEAIWGPLSERARGKGLDVSWDVPEAAACRADPALLRLLLTNLLANAVEHTPPGGALACRVTVAGERCEVTLSNRPADLTPEDLGHMFERFWRKDAARTGAHSGLGLALARSFAEAMGMQIHAELLSPGVLALTVSGTAADAPARVSADKTAAPRGYTERGEAIH